MFIQISVHSVLVSCRPLSKPERRPVFLDRMNFEHLFYQKKNCLRCLTLIGNSRLLLPLLWNVLCALINAQQFVNFATIILRRITAKN